MIRYLTLVVGSMQSNCYIVYNTLSSEAIIIDPGADADSIITQIEVLNVKPKTVILTHGHFDHIGAVDEICEQYGIGIIVHDDDLPLLVNSIYNLSDCFGDSVIVKCKDIRAVTDEETLLIGERFEFISTPGHSNGSMCIRVDELLFTGDTLFRLSIGNEFPPFGSFEREIHSIKTKLFTLTEDLICLPGHGIATSLEFEKNNNHYIR